MDNRVVIQYTHDVKAEPNQPGHLAGERFTVTDAATAKALHPHAKIVSYANGQKFVPGDDDSLVAEREAAKSDKPEKPAKPSKPAEKPE